MAVYVVFMLLGMLAALLIGSVGYFLCYLKNEKKAEEEKKKKQKYNGYSGWYAYW